MRCVDPRVVIELAYIVIPALVIPVVLLGLRRDRVRVTKGLRAVAEPLNGTVVHGTWPFHATLQFELEGDPCAITCRYGSQGGERAARTFSWTVHEGYHDLVLDVQRRPEQEGLLECLGKQPADTGDSMFDRAFFSSGNVSAQLLSQELRRAMLRVDPKAMLHLRVGCAQPYRTATGGVQPDEPRLEVSVLGVPPTPEHLQGLVEVTLAAHRCLGACPDQLQAA